MNGLVAFILNEAMTVLTIVIVFPGMLSAKGGVEIVLTCLMIFIMSFVWWIYLAVAPLAFLAMWLLGGLSANYWLTEWPWKYLFGTPA